MFSVIEKCGKIVHESMIFNALKKIQCTNQSRENVTEKCLR